MNYYFTRDSCWKSGRFFFYPKNHQSRECIAFEYYFFKPTCRISFGFNDEADLKFNLAIPFLFNFYLTFENFKIIEKISPKRKKYASWKNNEEYLANIRREFCFSIHHWTIWLQIWGDSDRWDNEDNFINQQHSFQILGFLDKIFGHKQYYSKDLEDWKEISIPMEENIYTAKYKLKKEEWKRKRLPFWPFIFTRYNAQVEIPGGIPFPGKGENSWDCGMDGLFGMNVNLGEDSNSYKVKYDQYRDPIIIGEIVKSVLEYRMKYGGKNWKIKNQELLEWTNSNYE